MENNDLENITVSRKRSRASVIAGTVLGVLLSFVGVSRSDAQALAYGNNRDNVAAASAAYWGNGSSGAYGSGVTAKGASAKWDGGSVGYSKSYDPQGMRSTNSTTYSASGTDNGKPWAVSYKKQGNLDKLPGLQVIDDYTLNHLNTEFWRKVYGMSRYSYGWNAASSGRWEHYLPDEKGTCRIDDPRVSRELKQKADRIYILDDGSYLGVAYAPYGAEKAAQDEQYFNERAAKDSTRRERLAIIPAGKTDGVKSAIEQILIDEQARANGKAKMYFDAAEAEKGTFIYTFDDHKLIKKARKEKKAYDQAFVIADILEQARSKDAKSNLTPEDIKNVILDYHGGALEPEVQYEMPLTKKAATEMLDEAAEE